jgi:hypothetical protein
MKKTFFLFTLTIWCFSVKAESNNEAISEENTSTGKADIVFGRVKGEEQVVQTSGSRKIAGIYPHLTTYSQSRKDGKFFKDGHQECGIGGIIPWADQLWMITYAPHKPRGSDHKLYSIDQNMTMTIHSESVGGTPAARMIHEESKQLFIGHYVIDAMGKVRAINPSKMPARVTAFMRHLKDPENFVYLYDMENMFYEVNVHTLAFKKLFHDPIPGYHGKGGFTSQGKVVVSNNGEAMSGHLDKPELWQVSQDYIKRGSEDRGCLATYDGEKWEVIERRQYTEVIGPEGVHPTQNGKEDPVWAIGWDKRSLRLQVMKNGKFTTFLLPKGCLNNDAAHGWFTEWPRIRDVGQKDLLMDMHGMFFSFPKDFTSQNCGGLEPIGSHIRYIPDFCYWNGKIVLATDEASIQGNPLVGQPQSNLWFGDFEDLKKWGPLNAAGSIYMNDRVEEDIPSDPFLINGFPQKMVHLVSDRPVTFSLEVDFQGNGQFEEYKKIKTDGYESHIFAKDFKGQWIRVVTDKSCQASISFQFSDNGYRNSAQEDKRFQSIADYDEGNLSSALLFPNAHNRHLSVLSSDGNAYDFDHVSFKFDPLKKESVASKCISPEALKGWGSKALEKTLREFLAPKMEFSADEASVILISKENRSIVGKKGNRTVLRLPKGPSVYNKTLSFGHPRMHREVESERMLANIHGTFYEVPFWIVGQAPLYTKMRPICTHNKQISDFSTWNGLLVLAGLKPNASLSGRVFNSPNGKTSLWFGGIDDLWEFGKPVGVGGPWKNTKIKANESSDPYLMTGYDQKTLILESDKDCTITAEIDIDHWTGFHPYKTFSLRAGKNMTFQFPDGFAAHWIRFKSDKEIKSTAQLIYK